MSNEPTGRIPRHDLDAEACVLSALLDSPGALPDVEPILAATDFYAPANGKIYEAVVALAAEGSPVDSQTVASWLKARGRLAEIGGVPYLVRILDAAPAVANVVAYAQSVLACSQQRRAVALCQRVAAEGYGDVGDVDSWIDTADESIHALACGGGQGVSYQEIRTVMRDELRKVESAWRGGVGTKRILSGLPSLDEKLSMMAGDLIIVGARPGMGKTAFVGGMMAHAVSPSRWEEGDRQAWADETIAAAIHTQEMPAGQIALRLLCSEARVDLSALRRGHLRDDDWPALTASSQHLSTLPLWIDDKASVSLDYIRKSVRALRRECDKRSRADDKPTALRLLVIDYLQLMRFEGRKGATKSELVGDTTRGLKELAKDEGLVVVLLSQLNRGLESRDNKRPVLSDLRDSGEIEQDADAVLFLYRDGYYNKASRNPDIAEVIIAKQRNGPPDRVLVRWTGAHTLFSDLSPSEREQLRFEAETEKAEPKRSNSGAKSW